MLIVNADDWGKNKTATNNSLVCFRNNRITSVSAMVFMNDSQRAAEIALEYDLSVGLHLNFTTRFNQNMTSSRLLERQRCITNFIQSNKYSFLLYNPVLKNDFCYVYNAQYEEYIRIYHKEPSHINGHHHMHLCTNMLLQRLIPKNSMVRRNFSFLSKEKNMINRLYRSFIDWYLLWRYQSTDFFFSIQPIHEPDHLNKIAELSSIYSVELMVHPEREDEYHYLMSDEYMRLFAIWK